MRRRFASVLLVVLAAAGLCVGSTGAAGVPPQLSEAESEALVRADVQDAFAAFVPPPGARPSPVEPAGDGGQLASPLEWRQDSLLYGWWALASSPEDVVASVRAHPPAGSQPSFVEDHGVSTQVPSSVTFRWPEVPRARGPVSLQATIMPLTTGGTGLRVSAEGFWLRPRPAGEAIPPGMRRLTITAWATPGPFRVAQPPVRITGPPVEAVASLLNSLPLVQPPRGPPPPCALAFPQVVVRLAFSRGVHQPPVAVAREEPGSCTGPSMLLDLDGHGEPLLEPEPGFIHQLSAAIGVKLDLTPVLRRAIGAASSQREPRLGAGTPVRPSRIRPRI